MAVESLEWRGRRDAGAYLRTLRANASARAPSGISGADWLAIRLRAFGDAIDLDEFATAVQPAMAHVPRARIDDCFRSLSGGRDTIGAEALLHKLFRDEPVYLLSGGEPAHAPLAALFTSRDAATLGRDLSRTQGWGLRQRREEDARAKKLDEALDNDARIMRNALLCRYAPHGAPSSARVGAGCRASSSHDPSTPAAAPASAVAAPGSSCRAFRLAAPSSAPSPTPPFLHPAAALAPMAGPPHSTRTRRRSPLGAGRRPRPASEPAGPPPPRIVTHAARPRHMGVRVRTARSEVLVTAPPAGLRR